MASQGATKRKDSTLYEFSTSQNRSLAQQITLLEIRVQNLKTKRIYLDKFTGTLIKNKGFPSNDIKRVETFINRAYAGKTNGLSLVIEEKAKDKGEGVASITITKDDPDFPMVITLKLKEMKRNETDVLRCVTLPYMSHTLHPPPSSMYMLRKKEPRLPLFSHRA